TLDDAMRQHLTEILGQTGWNISRTAALLGISRNTLRARMERYGLRERDPAQRAAAGPRPAPARAAPVPVASVPAPAAPPPPAPPPAARRWERRRLALVRVALMPPAGTDTSHETARALEVIVDKARTFGGRVDGIGPVGVMAVFGIEAPGDAATRAAHAAL